MDNILLASVIMVGQYIILKALRGDRYREGYVEGFNDALRQVDDQFYITPKPQKPRRHLRLVKTSKV